MTRRFLDDLRADINAQIIPNVGGLITADILRPLMIDTIDSSVDDEAGLGNTTPVIGLAVDDTNWTVLPSSVVRGGDAEFLIVDLPGNKITSTIVAGFSYNITGLASLIGGNNNVYELGVLQNGIQTGYIGVTTTRGPSKPVSVQAYELELSTASSTDFQIGIRIVSAAAGTVDVVSSANIVTILPTNNA
jgi:hypothetical protein